MGEYVTDRDIVIPGQLLADDGKRAGEGTYLHAGKVYASQIGLAMVRDGMINVIVIKGPYLPRPEDLVVGIVTDVKPSSIDIDLGGSLVGSMRQPPRTEFRRPRLNVGDVVVAKVRSSGLRGVFLEYDEDFRKMERGMITKMTPTKVPRLIGRKGSMITLIKKETGCEFYVGRNGLIVVIGTSTIQEFKAISAIQMIEKGAHTAGLTDRVTEFLRTGGN